MTDDTQKYRAEWRAVTRSHAMEVPLDHVSLEPIGAFSRAVMGDIAGEEVYEDEAGNQHLAISVTREPLLLAAGEATALAFMEEIGEDRTTTEVRDISKPFDLAMNHFRLLLEEWEQSAKFNASEFLVHDEYPADEVLNNRTLNVLSAHISWMNSTAGSLPEMQLIFSGILGATVRLELRTVSCCTEDPFHHSALGANRLGLDFTVGDRSKEQRQKLLLHVAARGEAIEEHLEGGRRRASRDLLCDHLLPIAWECETVIDHPEEEWVLSGEYPAAYLGISTFIGNRLLNARGTAQTTTL